MNAAVNAAGEAYPRLVAMAVIGSTLSLGSTESKACAGSPRGRAAARQTPEGTIERPLAHRRPSRPIGVRDLGGRRLEVVQAAFAQRPFGRKRDGQRERSGGGELEQDEADHRADTPIRVRR